MVLPAVVTRLGHLIQLDFPDLIYQEGLGVGAVSRRALSIQPIPNLSFRAKNVQRKLGLVIR